MAVRFELVVDPSGKFHFQLRAPDGGVLLQGLSCDSRIMAQNEVLHTRNSLQDEARVIGHVADDGTRFVVVKDQDGTVLARSPHVGSQTLLEELLAKIRNAAVSAPLVDLSKRKLHDAAH